MRPTLFGPERDDGVRSRGRGGGSRWRRRAVALVGATSLAVGIAGVAWADAPDPAANTAFGRIIPNPPGAPAGAVTVSVEGDWAWPTHRSDCNTNRFATGYNVDWHDPNDQGPYTLTGTDKQGNRISATPGTANDYYTHYTGGLSKDRPGGPRCGTYDGGLGYNTGHWGPITHTYTVPPTTINACVVTYDLHQGNSTHPWSGESGITSKDIYTNASDNSVQKNGSTPGGNQCAKIVIDHPLSLDVTKTNDASGDNAYNQTETAPTAGADVPFKVTVKNTSAYSETVTSFADTVGGVAVPGVISCLTAGGANLIGTVIAAGDTATCTFNAPSYSPASGTRKTNQVDIGVSETSNPNNTKTGSATSVVVTRTTPALSVRIDKTNDADGSGTYSDLERAKTAGQDVNFRVVLTNTSSVDVKVDSLTDEWPGQAAKAISCAGATVLHPNQPVTCDFTETGYAPTAAQGAKTNTAKLTVSEVGDSTNKASDSDDSTVRPPLPPDAITLVVDKTNNADLQGGFSDRETAAVAGQDVAFQAVITNTSNVPVKITSITDTYPGVNAADKCAGLIGNTLAKLGDPGSSTTCSFTIAGYSPAAGTSKTNTVRVDVVDAGNANNTGFDTDTSVVDTRTPPHLSVFVDKTNNADQVAGFHDRETATKPGQDVVFQAIVTNTSQVPVRVDSVTDTYDATTIAVCGLTGTVLAAGASVPCTFTVTGYSPAAGNNKLDTVRVDVSEPNFPGNTAFDTDTSVVDTPAAPRLAITVDKTNNADRVGAYHDRETAATAGQSVDFKAVITNTSAVAVSIDAITDTYLATTVNECPALLHTTIPAGGSVTCTFTVANYSPAAGTSKTNTVRVDVSQVGDATNTTSDSDTSVVDTQGIPPLTITVDKTNDADRNGSFTDSETAGAPGRSVDFKAVITNTSAVGVRIEAITDTFGATTLQECPGLIGTVLSAAGTVDDHVTCTFTVASYSPAAGTTLTNTVKVDVSEENNPANKGTGSDTSRVTTPALADLVVVVDKTNDADGNGTYTDSEQSPSAGRSVPFQAVITNAGSIPVRIDRVVDSFLATTLAECPNLVGTTLAKSGDVGSSATCRFTVDNYSPAAGSSLTNTVRVDVTDVPTGRTATDTDTSTVSTATATPPDLGISKTGPTTVRPGDTMSYTLTVSNTGTVPASNFTVTDTLPAGLTLSQITPGAFTCAAGGQVNCVYSGTLAPGAKAVIGVTALLASTYTAPSVSNTAVVGPTDGTPTDNTSTWVTPVEQPVVSPPDLKIVKNGPATAKPGDQLVYTLDVTNTGVVPASGFTVTDPLAAGLTLISASGAGFTCTGPGVSCTFPGVLDPGNKVTVTVAARLASNFGGDSVTNTATVGPPDGTPSDNTSTWNTPVQQPGVINPDLGITKTADVASVAPGGKVTYTLTVRNTGLVSATGFTVSDELPPALSLVSISGDGFTCTAATVSCTYGGTLMPGATASVSVVTMVASSFTGSSVTDVAVVAPTDGTPSDNRAELTTPVNRPSPPPLPFTGSNTYQMLLSALTLLSVGAALVLAGRRRRREV